MTSGYGCQAPSAPLCAVELPDWRLSPPDAYSRRSYPPIFLAFLLLFETKNQAAPNGAKGDIYLPCGQMPHLKLCKNRNLMNTLNQQINRSTDQQINRSTDQQINRSTDQAKAKQSSRLLRKASGKSSRRGAMGIAAFLLFSNIRSPFSKNDFKG
ncbi:hypothetical protein K5D37_25435 [Pseudomonas cichorii]|nr:hypothetical protein [Pseudomonas cichorii]